MIVCMFVCVCGCVRVYANEYIRFSVLFEKNTVGDQVQTQLLKH